MDKYKLLLAVLAMYASNFKNLHWNAKGLEFDTTHKLITSDYHTMCDDNVDVVAEMIARLGDNAPNYNEITQIATDSAKEHLLVDSTSLYDRNEIVEKTGIMLEDICECIVDVLGDDLTKNARNAGIKATLEAMLESFDIQARYLNARRGDVTETEEVVDSSEETPEVDTEEEVPDEVDEDEETEDEDEK